LVWSVFLLGLLVPEIGIDTGSGGCNLFEIGN
jgi:hypothetical protein